MTTSHKPVILTGIRSNEEPTLGNFLGAFLPIINMQKQYAGQYQINMFVPDLHSFNTPIDHKNLYYNTLTNLKYFIAAGLNIKDENTYIYRQSFIPAHSELAWVLDNFTYMGELQRATQFKDKSAKNSKSVTVGLFNYPVLMAADILLYNAKYVPVGEDQFQHLEITRDIAIRFNNKFGDIFTVPVETAKQTQFISRDSGLRIRSLVDPTKKMSKSDTNPKSKILLNDDPKVAYKKIMSATTDSLGKINFDFENQPGISSLLQILAQLTNKPQDEINQKWHGYEKYGDFKKEVAASVAGFLEDFQQKFAKINDEEVLRVLEESESSMNRVANAQLFKAQQAVGLRRPN